MKIPWRSQSRLGRCDLLLLDFACACRSAYRLLDSFGISQIIMTNRLEVVIEFLYQRHSGRNVQIDNLPVWDVLQVLHQGAQAVAMGRN